VTLALQYKAEVDYADASGRTALHMLAANGGLALAGRVLDAGASPNAQNESGNTPLHYACLNGVPEMVQLLLSHGARPTLCNGADRTPMDECLGRAGKGHRRCAELIRAATNAERDEERARALAAEGPGEEPEVEEVDVASGASPSPQGGDVDMS